RQNVLDAVPMGHAQEESARLAEQTAEFLAAQTNGGRIDHGERFAQVVREECIEQHLIAVLQSPQEHVPGEIARLVAKRFQSAADLLVEGRDVWREQTVQLKDIALRFGECRSFVEQW